MPSVLIILFVHYNTKESKRDENITITIAITISHGMALIHFSDFFFFFFDHNITTVNAAIDW